MISSAPAILTACADLMMKKKNPYQSLSLLLALLLIAGCLRGRQPGELLALLESGLIEAQFAAEKITRIPDETAAIELALKQAQRGDLVCIMTGRVRSSIAWLYSYKEKVEPTVAIELPETDSE